MKFSHQQLAAVTKMAMAMATADGITRTEEMNFIAYELSRFGVKPGQVDALIDSTVEQPFDEAIAMIRTLDDEQKLYVSAFLGGVMSCDGEVDLIELRLWQYTCALCSLPKITLEEAIDYIKDLD